MRCAIVRVIGGKRPVPPGVKPRTGWASRASSLARRWRQCRRGVSAVEFALIGPALVLCLLATVDLGFGMTERMAIDHVLRSGAQRAIEDPGVSSVTEVMKSAAKLNFSIAEGDGASGSELALSAIKFCACPENTGVAVVCSTICSGFQPTYIYYQVSAQKTYSGRIVPDITIDRSVQVQIR